MGQELAPREAPQLVLHERPEATVQLDRGQHGVARLLEPEAQLLAHRSLAQAM